MMMKYKTSQSFLFLVASLVCTAGRCLAFSPRVRPGFTFRMKLSRGSKTEEESLISSLLPGKANDDNKKDPLLQQFSDASEVQSSGFTYVDFAKDYPFANNIGIATIETAAADLLAQTVIAGTPYTEIDAQRSWLFCLFGAFYLGAFNISIKCKYSSVSSMSIDSQSSRGQRSWKMVLDSKP